MEQTYLPTICLILQTFTMRFRKGFRRVFYFWFRCFKHSDDNPRNGAAAHWNSCPGSPDHVRSGRNGELSKHEYNKKIKQHQHRHTQIDPCGQG
jgi:hypothetical protein